jgi:hypothetical protein
MVFLKKWDKVLVTKIPQLVRMLILLFLPRMAWIFSPTSDSSVEGVIITSVLVVFSKFRFFRF